MESILASIHHEIALVNELSGQDDLQIKEDFLTALEHALNIMKKSSDIITDVQKSSVQSVEVSRHHLFVLYSGLQGLLLFLKFISNLKLHLLLFKKEENTSADPQQDSNHSIHLLLQQKTLQMDLLQLEVNGLKANLILTQYLVKVIERKHEILVRRREVNIKKTCYQFWPYTDYNNCQNFFKLLQCREFNCSNFMKEPKKLLLWVVNPLASNRCVVG